MGMNAGSVDMVLTSPPYDNIRQYNGFAFDLDGVIRGIKHVLKDGGVCVWVVGDQMVNGSETCTSFKQALAFVDAGFNLHDTMIYHKRNSVPNIPNDSVRYHQSFEFMLCFSKGKPTTFNPITIPCVHAGKIKQGSFRIHGKDELVDKGKSEIGQTRVVGNVFSYTTGCSNTTAYLPAFQHPAVFPEKLARDQIISWTNSGDTVLDPFMGSGTTLFCCRYLGRNAIGIDISHEYCELAERRLAEEKVPKWATAGAGSQMTIDAGRWDE